MYTIYIIWINEKFESSKSLLQVSFYYLYFGICVWLHFAYYLLYSFSSLNFLSYTFFLIKHHRRRGMTLTSCIFDFMLKFMIKTVTGNLMIMWWMMCEYFSCVQTRYRNVHAIIIYIELTSIYWGSYNISILIYRFSKQLKLTKLRKKCESMIRVILRSLMEHIEACECTWILNQYPILAFNQFSTCSILDTITFTIFQICTLILDRAKEIFCDRHFEYVNWALWVIKENSHSNWTQQTLKVILKQHPE